MENHFLAGDEQNTHNLLGIDIEGGMRSKLHTVVSWSRITAVGGFVNLLLNFLSSIIVFSSDRYRDTTWLIVSTIISLAISFFLNFFLILFSRHLKKSLDMEDQDAFIAATLQLRSYMRMLGILFVVAASLAIVSYGYFFSAGGSRLF